MSKKSGPNKGNKCSISWHNHAPHECPGRAKIMCAVCGKALIRHKTFKFCMDGKGEKMDRRYLIDEIGRRRGRRDT